MKGSRGGEENAYVDSRYEETRGMPATRRERDYLTIGYNIMDDYLWDFLPLNQLTSLF